MSYECLITIHNMISTDFRMFYELSQSKKVYVKSGTELLLYLSLWNYKYSE